MIIVIIHYSSITMPPRNSMLYDIHLRVESVALQLPPPPEYSNLSGLIKSQIRVGLSFTELVCHHFRLRNAPGQLGNSSNQLAKRKLLPLGEAKCGRAGGGLVKILSILHTKYLVVVYVFPSCRIYV